jgi:hypothetical protein
METTVGLANMLRARCRAQRQEDFYVAAHIFEERLTQGKGTVEPTAQCIGSLPERQDR